MIISQTGERSKEIRNSAIITSGGISVRGCFIVKELNTENDKEESTRAAMELKTLNSSFFLFPETP